MINNNEWMFALCCGNKAGMIWSVSEGHGDERMNMGSRQMWKLNWLEKFDMGHSGSYSLLRVRTVGVYMRWLGQHDRVDVKGRWHLGMSGNGEGEGVIRDCVKRGWSACGAGGGSNRDRRQGKKRMKLIIKEKRNILLVYATNLPAHMQGFRIPVIANVDGHMRITGQQTWRSTGFGH